MPDCALAHSVTDGYLCYNSRGWTFLPIICKFCFRATDSSRLASDMEVRSKQKYVIEFLHAERNMHVDIHRRLLNVYGDQTVDVSTVRLWSTLAKRLRRPNGGCENSVRRLVVRFSSGGCEVRGRSRSGNRAQMSAHEMKSSSISWSSAQTLNSDSSIATLTKQQARFRPERKTPCLLQHCNARPRTNLKTMEHAAKFGWAVLPHPPYGVARILFLLTPICSGWWKMD
jgi:hypothetical protein